MQIPIRIRQPGIFRVPVDGVGEELVIETNGPMTYWDVYDKGICYGESHSREKGIVRCHDFATGQTMQVVEVDALPPWGSSTFRCLSVSSDGQWLFYDQEDVSGNDLVLVENFR